MELKLMASFNGQNKNFCKSGISTCGTAIALWNNCKFYLNLL